ncbi:MAG: homoserine O-succinyltransferase [Lachnospiraceae bacterium]|nr:homoserine O-succinyltransferase [Lachnospiraceae bacterium]
MPIKVQKDLPAKAVIEKENIFIMDETRAISQDIRPLEIALVNLMPLKEDTEIQLIRALSNTPLQVNLTFIAPSKHKSKNTPVSHLNQFYKKFEEIKNQKFDGLIITGAPVELLEFEEVDFWDEIVDIMDWSENNVTSTIFLCWAAQAALYHFFGLKKYTMNKKISGVFQHTVHDRKIPLVRGFDDVFWAPHSRNTEIRQKDISKTKEVMILADSKEVGVFLAMSEDGKKVFVMGHPEYDRNTLDFEYKRDTKKGLNPEIPKNYYPDNDPSKKPQLTWRGHANTLYTNWLNYYVYQVTPYEIEQISK